MLSIPQFIWFHLINDGNSSSKNRIESKNVQPQTTTKSINKLNSVALEHCTFVRVQATTTTFCYLLLCSSQNRRMNELSTMCVVWAQAYTLPPCTKRRFKQQPASSNTQSSLCVCVCVRVLARAACVHSTNESFVYRFYCLQPPSVFSIFYFFLFFLRRGTHTHRHTTQTLTYTCIYYNAFDADCLCVAIRTSIHHITWDWLPAWLTDVCIGSA